MRRAPGLLLVGAAVLAACASSAGDYEQRLDEAVRGCGVPEGAIRYRVNPPDRLVFRVEDGRITADQVNCFTAAAREAGLQLPIGEASW